eukprot:gene27311-36057_t
MSPATTLKPSSLARLGYEGDLDKISKTYQMVTFNISKSPYILIPFMGSNIEMRMTSCSPIHYQLFHERIASYRQPLYDTVNAADFIELLQVDILPPGSAVRAATHNGDSDEDLKHFYGSSTTPADQNNLLLPKPKLRKGGSVSANGKAQKANQHSTSNKSSSGKASDSNQYITSYSANGNASPVRGNSANAAGNSKIRTRDLIPSRYIGGYISWSILPMVNSEYSNEAGFLLLLSQEYVTANKRKCWCILIDRIFFIYSINKHGHEVILKQQIEMSQAQISMLEQDIIQLKISTETMFFHCLTQKEHNIWFRLSKLNLQHGKSFSDLDELMKHSEVNLQLQFTAIKHLRNQYKNIQPQIVERER